MRLDPLCHRNDHGTIYCRLTGKVRLLTGFLGKCRGGSRSSNFDKISLLVTWSKNGQKV